MKQRLCVVGGGFSGIAAAYMASKKGFDVTLVNAAPFLGGVLHSTEIDGYIYDLGCHLLDGAYSEQADVIRDILNYKINPYDALYASVFKGNIRIGSELCHVANSHDQTFAARILFEMLNNITDDCGIQSFDCLYDLLIDRYGKTAATILRQAYQKVIQQDLRELDSVNLNVLNLRRLSFLPDSMAMTLKKILKFDQRIAARSVNDPLKFRQPNSDQGYRTFYPETRGMLGFCESAEKKLNELGVEIVHFARCTKINSSINNTTLDIDVKSETKSMQHTYDSIFWATDVSELASLMGFSEDVSLYNTSVPLVLFYFNVPEASLGDIDYVHNYDEDTLSFRISAPSKFGNDTTPAGMGYICAEVPTKIYSDLWNMPESFAEVIWHEVSKSKVLRDVVTFPGLANVLKTPVSYGLKKIGYTACFNRFCEQFWGRGNIYFSKKAAFSKAYIFEELKNVFDVEL